jgi:glycosyltransferase involved in cell wall biosynthesis
MHVLNQARNDQRVMRSATALVEAGFTVSIVGVESDRTPPGGEAVGGVCIKHVFMPSWFVPTRFKPWFLVKVVRVVAAGSIRLLREPADVYHAHDAEALPACYVAASLRRKRLVLDAHELPMSRDDPLARRWPRLSAVARHVFGALLPRCTAIVTSSPRYAEEMRRHFSVPTVAVVRNVPPFREVSRTSRLKDRLGLGPGVRIALYQGLIQADRGLKTLVHAAQYLDPDIVVVLMGGAEPQTLRQLQEFISSTQVEDRVHILPPVQYAELLEWTSSADLGLVVLPVDYSASILLTLPNKVFEYLMAGLPVLSSRLPAVEDIIGTFAVGEVVPSADPRNIASALNAMVVDSERLDRMRTNALRAARRELNWEVESRHLVELYLSMFASESSLTAKRLGDDDRLVDRTRDPRS